MRGSWPGHFGMAARCKYGVIAHVDVPDDELRYNSLPGPKAHLDAASGKLHSDGGLHLQTELIARKSAQQVGLADPRVTDEHHLEEVVIAARDTLYSVSVLAHDA